MAHTPRMAYVKFCVLAALVLCLQSFAAEALQTRHASYPARLGKRLGGFRRGGSTQQSRSVRNDKLHSIGCLKEMWFDQRLDHFHWSRGQPDATYRQRYFICDKFWSRGVGTARGPVFFYGERARCGVLGAGVGMHGRVNGRVRSTGGSRAVGVQPRREAMQLLGELHGGLHGGSNCL